MSRESIFPNGVPLEPDETWGRKQWNEWTEVNDARVEAAIRSLDDLGAPQGPLDPRWDTVEKGIEYYACHPGEMPPKK